MPELQTKLGSSPDGLSQAEAEKRLTQYGPNKIEEKKTNPFLKFLTYFWGPIPWMIEAAVILSAVARHWPDFGIILLLLAANAVVGFWEEHVLGGSAQVFGFINEHRTQWSVEEMCRVLSVSRSGYYRWRGRPESRRAIENRRLDAHIKAIFMKSKRRYGSPKITDELNDMGFPIGKNRVARRMKAAGLRSIVRRKYRATTDSKHSHPVADNLLQRDFTADGPDKVWVSDITYIATARGWLYLTVFIDLFSRMVVGWALSSSLSTEMVLTALSGASVIVVLVPG